MIGNDGRAVAATEAALSFPTPDVTLSPVDEHVAAVELCRPPDNPLDLALLTGIADALEAAAADPDCRVVLVRSQGKHFSSGAALRGKQKAAAPGVARRPRELQ